MCGRITQVADELEIEEVFSATREGPEGIYRVNHNLGPLQDAAVIGAREGARVLRLLRWGLIPTWVKDAANAKRIAAACVNARGDTVADKPAFRTAFAKRRCIVPASGYYEWATSPEGKRPFYFHPTRGSLLALAGLWEYWRDPDSGEERRTFALITTEPNAVAARVHDRMPVILPAERWDGWLSTSTPRDALVAMLRPCADDLIGCYEVGRAVGNIRNNGPELIEPVRAA